MIWDEGTLTIAFAYGWMEAWMEIDGWMDGERDGRARASETGENHFEVRRTCAALRAIDRFLQRLHSIALKVGWMPGPAHRLLHAFVLAELHEGAVG